jgi:5'(3')-deoxyribonucleotidase
VQTLAGGRVKKILYIDMDGVLVDFASSFEHVSDGMLQEFEGREDDIPGIFSHMEPKPGALEAFRELAAIYDTYILSTSPWENPSAWSAKLIWVKTHLGRLAHRRLILTHHKDLNRGDYLVDDNTKNGAAEFEGELICFGSERFPDWPAVVRYLRERAGEKAT